MKYAILGPRGDINRILETQPENVSDQIVVELTDEQAATVLEGQDATPMVRYFYEEGELISATEKRAAAFAARKAQRKAERLAGMSIEEIKAEKLKELEADRWKAEIAGTTVAALGNAPVLTDKETQSELGKALALLTIDPDFEVDWKFPHGEIIRLNGNTIKLVASVVFAHVQSTRTHFKQLADAVTSAETKEAVTSIVW